MPGQSVIDAAAQALRDGKDRYCNVIGVPALRQELAAYLDRTRSIQVSPENIVIAPGCKLSLFQSMMALLEPGDEVLYPDPGFPGYASITLGLGAVPVPFTLSAKNKLQPDPDESCVEDYAAHSNAADELARQPDWNRLHRRSTTSAC